MLHVHVLQNFKIIVMQFAFKKLLNFYRLYDDDDDESLFDFNNSIAFF